MASPIGKFNANPFDWSESGQAGRPQHFLNFFPLPQGQASFRPILSPRRPKSPSGAVDSRRIRQNVAMAKIDAGIWLTQL
jgi:hypothetical protein